MLKCVCEGRSVVTPGIICHILANSIHEITDILTVLVPSEVLGFAPLFGVDGDFHTVVEERVWLRVVQNVELDLHAGASVLNLEEEPLRMALRIDIVLHQQVVLNFRNFLRQVEVATFES